MTTTTFTDIHSDIIQTHILPRLDGPSLSTTATASSHLKSLCSDDRLWSQISRSTWPSITHPRLHHVISTFPSGHRSFFHDCFPALTTVVNYRRHSSSDNKSNCVSYNLDREHFPSELISAVDIRYQNDVVYSATNFTKITTEFLSSPVRLKVNPVYTEPAEPVDKTINLTVDEIIGADETTLSNLKASLTLNWILINPTSKRACNLSSVKAVSARADWVTNETHIRYVTVLPGCDPNKMVQCKIYVVLGVGEGGFLKVNEVVLKLHDLGSCCLNGFEFLGVVEAGLGEKNNVRREIVDDGDRLKSYEELKEIKRERKLRVKEKDRRRVVAVNCFGFFAILVSVFVAFYFVKFGFVFVFLSVLIAMYVYVEILE
ncbi:hypothetical protein QVD17_09097 [Tagetes erecta]|uniref:F-box protein n=1 Tax=Tagetes erecta TaxID=13708 RepID=A0AAD8L385_TARER|nr:hypothetical protein QVD17_09097 [Tagetes erecta]